MTVPLTVVGGYLGSGKTTLINRALLWAPIQQLRRLAILVNDFGEVNIDAALITSVSPDRRVLGLVGGCVCCAVQDELATALERVRTMGVEHVLIEASGVASPAKIARYGSGWSGFEARGAVVMVDGDTLPARRRDKFVGRLVQRQLDEADVLIVRGPQQRLRTEFVDKPLWTINDPNLDWLLDASRPLPAGSIPAPDAQPDLPEFVALSLRQRSMPSPAQLRQWLDAVPPSISRLKGFAHTTSGTAVVQATPETRSIEMLGDTYPGAADGRAGLLLAIAPAAVFDDANTAVALQNFGGDDWAVSISLRAHSPSSATDSAVRSPAD